MKSNCAILIGISILFSIGCSKSVSTAIPESAKTVSNLPAMLRFLDDFAQVSRHPQDSTLTWWHLETVLIDGKPIKHNTVFFPSFSEISTNCQTSREFNFYQAEICPDQNIIVPVKTNVTIYAGQHEFEWRDAPIQWRQNRTSAFSCPGESWQSSKLPKRIVIRVKARTLVL